MALDTAVAQLLQLAAADLAGGDSKQTKEVIEISDSESDSESDSKLTPKPEDEIEPKTQVQQRTIEIIDTEIQNTSLEGNDKPNLLSIKNCDLWDIKEWNDYVEIVLDLIKYENDNFKFTFDRKAIHILLDMYDEIKNNIPPSVQEHNINKFKEIIKEEMVNVCDIWSSITFTEKMSLKQSYPMTYTYTNNKFTIDLRFESVKEIKEKLLKEMEKENIEAYVLSVINSSNVGFTFEILKNAMSSFVESQTKKIDETLDLMAEETAKMYKEQHEENEKKKKESAKAKAEAEAKAKANLEAELKKRKEEEEARAKAKAEAEAGAKAGAEAEAETEAKAKAEDETKALTKIAKEINDKAKSIKSKINGKKESKIKTVDPKIYLMEQEDGKFTLVGEKERKNIWSLHLNWDDKEIEMLKSTKIQQSYEAFLSLCVSYVKMKYEDIFKKYKEDIKRAIVKSKEIKGYFEQDVVMDEINAESIIEGTVVVIRDGYGEWKVLTIKDLSKHYSELQEDKEKAKIQIEKEEQDIQNQKDALLIMENIIEEIYLSLEEVCRKNTANLWPYKIKDDFEREFEGAYKKENIKEYKGKTLKLINKWIKDNGSKEKIETAKSTLKKILQAYFKKSMDIICKGDEQMYNDIYNKIKNAFTYNTIVEHYNTHFKENFRRINENDIEIKSQYPSIYYFIDIQKIVTGNLPPNGLAKYFQIEVDVDVAIELSKNIFDEKDEFYGDLKEKYADYKKKSNMIDIDYALFAQQAVVTAIITDYFASVLSDRNKETMENLHTFINSISTEFIRLN